MGERHHQEETTGNRAVIHFSRVSFLESLSQSASDVTERKRTDKMYSHQAVGGLELNS